MQISLQHITKQFPRCTALDDLSLELNDGKTVAVLGENGAGKSTLLSIISGVSVADKGSVSMDGEVFDRTKLQLRRRMIFTPDTPVLFRDDTVIRNVAAFAQLYEIQIADRVDEIAAFMHDIGIGTLANQWVGGLSRGQAWKAAMTCVHAVRPDLWLVDEPFASGMDAIGIAAFKRLVRDLNSEGKMVIYTTQMIDLATEFADHVLVIRQGKVIMQQSGAELRELIKGRDDAGEAILKGTLSPSAP